jgi:biotin carboxyl carrier protein
MMRYVAEIDGTTYNVDIDGAGEALQLQINGQAVAADLQQVTAPSLFSLIRDGQSFEVFAEPVEKGYAIVIAGERFVVNVADERSLRLASVQKRDVSRRGDLVVKSPMPGLVVDVLVQAGDTLAAGQPLVILVAMKMENEIRAFESGAAKAVHVRKGDKVDVGQALVTIG